MATSTGGLSGVSSGCVCPGGRVCVCPGVCVQCVRVCTYVSGGVCGGLCVHGGVKEGGGV